MKVIGLVPVEYRKDSIIVQMTQDEWANILGVGYSSQVPAVLKPTVGTAVDIHEQWRRLQNVMNLADEFDSTAKALVGIVSIVNNLKSLADKLNAPPPPVPG